MTEAELQSAECREFGPEGNEVVASLVAEVFDKPQPAPDWQAVPLSRIVDNETAEWPPLHEALLEFRAWLQS